MKYAYFPGCAMDSVAKCYRLATEYVMDKMGVSLIEIKDWNCCGATSAHVKNDLLGVALPARALAIAERDCPEFDVVTGCAACYGRLKIAAYRVRADTCTRYMVEKTIELPYEAKREVLNFLDIFARSEAIEAIKESITRPLTGLKVACYYGCLNARPSKVTGVDCTENPMSMDHILSLAGVTTVPWSFKTECCGAAQHNAAASATCTVPEHIIRNAQANGAEAIAVACPMCNMNLEMRQRSRKKKTGAELIPVYALTEILAVAMGASAKRMALEAHFVPAAKPLAEAIRRNKEGVE